MAEQQKQGSKDRVALGWDIGGTKAVAVLARSSHEVLAESRLDNWSSGDWHSDLERLIEQGRALLEQANIPVEQVERLGLSAPGPLDPASGRILDTPNLVGWTDVPICRVLGAAFGATAILQNDANAAALAEWQFGAGVGEPDLIYLTLSTGLGAGLVLNGRLHPGQTGQGGEVGHLPLVPQGRPCRCGLRGCWEAYVGGLALADRIREDIGNGRTTSILKLAGGRPEAITATRWVDAIREGDAYAVELRAEFVERLAQGLATLIATLDPSCIALGTIIARNPDLFLDDVRARTRELTWTSLHHTKIVPAQLGDALPRYAALAVAFEAA